LADGLRIGQIAPISAPVAPDTGSSIEQIVSLLTEELVRRGHEVTLFACGESQTSARLHAVYPRSFYADDELWNWELHDQLNAAAAFERAEEFDVIHSHAYHFALPFTRLVRTPVVHTYHVSINADITRAYSRFPEARVVAISDYQRQKMKGLLDVPVIHHGIDVDGHPSRRHPGDYLIFVGRMIPEKGPLEAIALAEATGLPLVLVGPPSDYFHAHVEPRIDGDCVRYAGAMGPAARNELLADAAALVYPLTVSEPFGMVPIEAMACGTPVAALAAGAVPELVDVGVTGYHATDLESLVRLIPDVLALDRARVRETAARRFDYRRMTDEYEEVYERALAARHGRGRKTRSRYLRAP
jgi:glycosyltransferase involved in cell wall biosynthesis